MVANIVSTFLPKQMFSKVAEPSALSRDPKVPEAYIADPLVSTTVSARWFTSVLAAHADTPRPCLDPLGAGARHAVRRRPPHRPGRDPLLGRRRTLRPGRLCRVGGLYHEMFNEPEKEMVFERLRGGSAERLADLPHILVNTGCQCAIFERPPTPF